MTALISNIQHYTIHDGPGIRTAVFFMGCTMQCIWCSNPETLEMRPRLASHPEKCLTQAKCGLCADVCPRGLIAFDGGGLLESISISHECGNCRGCANACPPRAIRAWGESMTVPQLMRMIEGDRGFYDRSGGGATLTGGEVMLQWEFAAELLKSCQDARINTCVETALHCPTEHMEAVYRHADFVITDIKHMDSTAHKNITGVGNELVLYNLRRTVELGKKLVIRTPVIPGYNGDEENIRATAAFIRDELGGNIAAYQLLPYRPLGVEKYKALGIPYPMAAYDAPPREEWEQNLTYLAAMVTDEYGLPAMPGTSGKVEY